jgi:Carboxypeptidase regulatory-like domain
MTSPRAFSRRSTLPLGSFLLLSLAFLLAPASRAQTKDQKRAEAQLRTLHGSVINKSEDPVPSSIVYLKNVKSQSIKTYIADSSGNYKFSGLDPNVDYELHAETQDLMSSTHTISSFDSRRDIEVILKLNHKKEPSK